ncbi:MAG TPA: cytochrome b N-terminal domain-containing protein [Vicinamibacterales bacterium]|nr:cytochrome b N-terminal domain-containing protein [Vicinamibacterales bacterium]
MRQGTKEPLDMRVMQQALDWLESRLPLGAFVRELAGHRVPQKSASWWYVFGSAAVAVLVLQLVTGVLLAVFYVPSAGEAWSSLQALNHDVPFGWFVRALHGWGSNFMVALVAVHLAQVFLFGAYKFPRELTWMAGVVLLLLTLGMAFTGQLLRFDQDAYWGIGIGVSIASRVPIAGPWLVDLMLGGPIIAGATLSRFFALHVMVIPGLLLALLGLHLLLVVRLGINEWPVAGRPVRRATYRQEYDELTRRTGVPFVPYAIGKDVAFSTMILIAIVLCAFWLGPFGPGGQPDPTIIETSPRPDPPFLWLFALLSLLPPELETPALLIGPLVGILVLLALPLFSSEGEKSWLRRPIAVLVVLLSVTTFVTLTQLAGAAPWSPQMNAWSGQPIPAPLLSGRTAVERQGALVFQSKQCHNCHTLDGQGGKRGPALDAIAVRLTGDQLVRQVIQGDGNMPAYRKNLTPPQTIALVAFLQTLRPAGLPPARDASRTVLDGVAAPPASGAP